MGSYAILIVILIVGLEIARYFRRINRSIEELENLKKRVDKIEDLLKK